MKKAAIVMVAAALMGGSSYALDPNSPLRGRVIQDIGTITTSEITGGFGSMTRRGAVGQLTRTLPKAGKFVRYGGVVLLTAQLLNDGLHWFYDEAQKSINPKLDNYWRTSVSNGPAIEWAGLTAQYPTNYDQLDKWTLDNCGVQLHPEMIGGPFNYGTNKYENNAVAYLVYGSPRPKTVTVGTAAYADDDVKNARAEMRQLAVEEYSKVVSTCGPKGSSLADIMDDQVAQAIKDVMVDYLTTHPERIPSILTPLPNANELADDVVDPGLDTDRDRVTDGDELRRGPGVLTNPGNRPHVDDGEVTDPADSTSKPVDTDGDTIPDWRDADDDNDGVKDEDETPETQKDKTKAPDAFLDTDHDGLTDDVDTDDDNDDVSDIDEEKAGTDTKDAASKPENAEEEKAKEDCKVNGRTWDDTNKTCSDSDPEKPADNDCGEFPISRLLAYPGSYIRDLIFPCENPRDIIKPITDALKTKFPFSLASGLNGWFVAPTGGESPSQMPSKISIIPLDWEWLAPLWKTIKTIVGVALWAWFIYWIIDRFTPKVHI